MKKESITRLAFSALLLLLSSASDLVAQFQLNITRLTYRQVSLSWQDVRSAEGYIVERKEDNFGQRFVTIANLAGKRGLNTYDDYTVEPNKTYIYRVQGIYDKGGNELSDEKKVTTPIAPPTSPTGLNATGQGSGAIYLTWSDSNGSEASYVLERSSDGGNTFRGIATVAYSRTPSYTDVTVNAGSRYCYRVKSRNSTGDSEYSNTACANTAQNLPAAPSSLAAATAGSNQVNLSWTDNSNNEDWFELERSTDGHTFSRITDLSANTTSYQNSGLSANTRYWYRLRARNSGGYSDYSNTADALTRDVAPESPSGLVANAVSSQQINLSWTDRSGNETGFEIERSTDNRTFTRIATTGVNVTQYSDGSLQPATAYYYRVRAINSIGASPYSETASARTFQLPPSAPSALTAVTAGSGQINLSWKDNSGNEDGFELERSTDGRAFSKIADLAANVASYQSTGLTPNTRYWYRIRAVNNGGYSDYSNIADATTRDVAPESPSGLAANAVSYQQVNLNWTDRSGNETGFEVETSTDGVNFQKAGSVSANTTSYQASGLKELTKYYFRVRALNAIGYSAYSNVASATTPKAPVPDRPANLTATPLDYDLVRLRWSPVSANATTVVIERSLYADRDFTVTGTQPASQTQFDDREILPVADHYYRIKAVNSAGSSPYSAVAKISAADIITGSEPAGNTNTVFLFRKTLHISPGSIPESFIRIYDKNGLERLAFRIYRESEISLSNFPDGIYFVLITGTNGVSKHKILLY